MLFVGKKETKHNTECKICFKGIKKGEEYIIANLGSGFYAYRYHMDCFIKRYSKEIMRLAISVISL